MPTTVRPSQISNVPLAHNLVALNRADTTETTLSNSAAETTMWTGTLTGGVLGINDALQVAFYGSLLNNSGAGRTYTFRLKLGGTTIASMITPVTNSASVGAYQFQGFIKNAGATNSQKGTGFALAQASNGVVNGGSGSAAIDTTVNQTLALTIQADAATATQTLVQLLAVINYLKNT